MKMVEVKNKEDLEVGDLLFISAKDNKSNNGVSKIDCIDGNEMFLMNPFNEKTHEYFKAYIDEYLDYAHIYKVVAE